MSGNRNRNAAFVFTLSNLGSLIKLAEAFFGRGTGAEKKAAVTAVVAGVLQTGINAVAANNPKYADVIGEVGNLIDGKVEELKFSGELPSEPQPSGAE